MKTTYLKHLINKNQADSGDFLKIAAVSAVFLQSILGYGLNQHPNEATQILIGMLYNLVKYTAPAFIFGILFTNTKSQLGPNFHLKKFYLHILKAFFLPFYLWGIIYLLVFPSLQQVNHYHDWASFLWQLVNGNAAPHLWYAVMMLQFLLLMPLFNFIVEWIDKNYYQRIHKFTFILLITILLASLWLIFYDKLIFHGPHMHDWYLFDRFFMSFLLYGNLGMISAIFFEYYAQFLIKWKYLIAIIFVLSLIAINIELFRFGLPVKLVNAPYYKPSMSLYDLSVIFLISYLSLKLEKSHHRISTIIHNLANIAYLAYLPNAMWSWLCWTIFGAKLFEINSFLAILLVYILTWILSFLTAVIEKTIFS